MSVYRESNIEIDFSAAKTVIEHDKVVPTHSGGLVHRNSIWPGVDFCIEDVSGEWIWLEVKSWSPMHIPAKRRGGVRRSFLCKMKSNEFAKELRTKFLGTTAYLAWQNALPLAPTHFIMLFEPPHPLDSALLVTRSVHMSKLVLQSKQWAQPLSISMLPISEWNLRFPDYPAKLI